MVGGLARVGGRDKLRVGRVHVGGVCLAKRERETETEIDTQREVGRGLRAS